MTSQVLDKTIDNYTLHTTSLLGKGAFSEVYLGEDKRTQTQVAIKVLPLKFMKEGQLKMFLTREVPIMKSLSHPNIIKVHDVLMSKHHVYFAIEYCNQGDLDSLIKQKGKFKEKEVKQILTDVLAGLKELRRHNIMHRDLKPANIFKSNGVFKLGDFGFAKVVDSQAEIKHSYVGTPLYMSPQCLQNSGYGVMSFELLFGSTPWPCATYFQLLANLSSTPLKFPKKGHLSKSMKKFIKKCLKVSEAKRWSWEQLFQYDLFANKIKKIENSMNKENIDTNIEINKQEGMDKINEGRLNYEIRRILEEAQKSESQDASIMMQQEPKLEIEQGQFGNLVEQFDVGQIESNFTPKEKQSKSNIDKTLSEKYLEFMTTNYLEKQFEKNDQLISCLQNFIQIFNFTINLQESQILKKKELKNIQLKFLFMLQKSSLIYANELVKVIKNESASIKLNEYEQYLSTISLQFQIQFEKLTKSMEKIFLKNFEKLSKKKKFWSHIQDDKLFLLYFNNNTSNFKEIEEYSDYFIQQLSEYIKLIIINFEEKFNCSWLISQDQKLKILLISSLIDCHEIFLRIQSIQFNFAEFSKKTNFHEILIKQEEIFFNQINYNYFEFLKSTIKELQI